MIHLQTAISKSQRQKVAVRLLPQPVLAGGKSALMLDKCSSLCQAWGAKEIECVLVVADRKKVRNLYTIYRCRPAKPWQQALF